MFGHFRSFLLSTLVLSTCWIPLVADAGIFSDNEARQAILDMRKQLEQLNEAQRIKQEELNAQMSEELSQMRRNQLDLSNQVEAMRAEMARMQGIHEQLLRDLTDMQQRQKLSQEAELIKQQQLQASQAKVIIEGKEVVVDIEEKRLFDTALSQLRGADFSGAVVSLLTFQRRYPVSAYTDTARFWLGNAHYGKREYRDAITSFRGLLVASPQHSRSPEALLSIANCQIEMKDSKAARRSLEELMKSYPSSEAALAGKERLASLK